VEALWLYFECIQALVAKQAEAKWRLERGENAPRWTSTLHVNQCQERQALLQGDGQSYNLMIIIITLIILIILINIIIVIIIVIMFINIHVIIIIIYEC